MDIPSLFMIPSAVSSGKVHSVFPNSTDADFDFNRDSDATRVNSEGLIERVGYYGSEEVTNNTFSSATGWTLESGWSIANNYAVANTTSGFIYQIGSGLTNGKKYKVTFSISEYVSGSVFFGFGAGLVLDAGASVSANGNYTQFVDCTTSGTKFVGFKGVSFTGKINNFSVKEITGDRARLNYEIEGGLVNTKPSLLLEPQSTNLIPYSNPIEVSGGWQIFDNASIETNYEISPMGIKNASLVGTQGGVNDFIYDSITISNSATYTVSFYIKNINSQATGFYAPSATDGRINWNGAEISSIVGTGANYEELSNGWYRVHQTTTSTSTNIVTRIYSDKVSTGSVLIFGYQLEEQSYPTSLIPTNGSTQTRAAETCNGAGTSSIFESSEGILYCEIKAFNLDGGLRYISIGGSTDTNRLVIRFLNTTGNISAFSYPNGAITSIMEDTSTNPLVFNKVAMKWKVNDFALWVNGNKVATDTSGATFASGVFDRLQFSNPQGTSVFYGKVRDIRVYNTKEMTDSEVDILLTKITS